MNDHKPVGVSYPDVAVDGPVIYNTDVTVLNVQVEVELDYSEVAVVEVGAAHVLIADHYHLDDENSVAVVVKKAVVVISTIDQRQIFVLYVPSFDHLVDHLNDHSASAPDAVLTDDAYVVAAAVGAVDHLVSSVETASTAFVVPVLVVYAAAAVVVDQLVAVDAWLLHVAVGWNVFEKPDAGFASGLRLKFEKVVAAAHDDSGAVNVIAKVRTSGVIAMAKSVDAVVETDVATVSHEPVVEVPTVFVNVAI